MKPRIDKVIHLITHPIVKLLVFALIIFYIISNDTIDLKRLSSLMKAEVWLELLLIGLIYEVLKALRLKIIFASNELHFSLRFCLCLVFISHFLNNFFWGQAGGLVSKVFYVSSLKGASAFKITRAFFLEIYAGLIVTLAILVVLLLRVEFSDKSLQENLLVLISLLLLASLLIPLSSRLVKKISFRFGNYSLKELIDLKTLKDWRVYLLFTITYGLKALLLLTAGRAIYGDKVLTYFENFTVFLAGQFISLIPVGPSGAGSGHLGFNFLAQRLSGIDNNYGSDIFSAFWTTHFIFGLMGGVLFLLSKRKKTDEFFEKK